jgi:hypothetical protein
MRGPSCLVSTPAGLSLVYSPGLPPAAAAGSRARACPHSSVPALAIGEREDTLGPSTMPALSSPRGPMVDGSCVRFRSGPPGGSPPGLLSPSDSAACLRLLRPGCQPPRHLADCRISRRRHMGHCADRTCTCKYNSSSRCAPSRGSLGSHFPTFPGTRRREDCHPAHLRSLRWSLASRYLVRLVRSCCPLRAPGLGEAPRPHQGFWAPGPPFRACDKETEGSPKFPRYPSGCMPRSPTPVVSCALALAHPGLLPSGHWKPSAFPAVPLKDLLVSTTLRISGLNHAACIFVPSSSVRPLLGVHVDVTTDLLARLSSDGT